MEQILIKSSYYAYLGFFVILMSYFQVMLWLTTSHRQSFRIRMALFSAVLRQDIAWFDTHNAAELGVRLADDVNKIQAGIGDKIASFVQWVTTFLAAIVYALVNGWKLTLVMLITSPVLFIAGALMNHWTTIVTQRELDSYAKAGAVAEEALISIRTVVAYSGQHKECERYSKSLKNVRKYGVYKGMIIGGGIGFTFFMKFCTYAVTISFGGYLLRTEPQNYHPGNILIVLFCVSVGSLSLGYAAPNLQRVSAARGAAVAVWDIIDRTPVIDSSSKRGLKPATMTGKVVFKKVTFRYPSRPDVLVLNGLNLKVKPGQTIALVGSSGCGKSTVVQLIQRFYDPIVGSVRIDGVDVKELNIKWLRQHIGVVSQEPVLFAQSIGENIRYGRDGVTDTEIEQAARQANAHNFISQLPEKYKTLVGELGAQLSGGQKQRIAIARALVRNPKILLLDEATSALDTVSESTVQDALDKARLGRTTIIVAHRLSTIKTADVIYSLQDGVVHECGTHEELLKRNGIYYQLVMNQQMMEGGKDDDEETAEMEVSYHSVAQASSKSLMTIPSSLADDKKSLLTKNQEKTESVMWRIMTMNVPEWPLIVAGSISAIVNGLVQPVFAVLFSQMISLYRDAAEQQKKKELTLSMVFLALGVVDAVSAFLQWTMFGWSGEKLTLRIRERTLKALLRQDIAYFDDPRNSTGALTSRLAIDASAVQGATGVQLGIALQGLATLGVGIIIGFIYTWKLALVITAFCPLIMLSAISQMKLRTKGASKTNSVAFEQAGNVVTEALVNIRTVASLTKKEKSTDCYRQFIEIPYRDGLREAHTFGFVFAFSECFKYFTYAATFSFGGWLVIYDELDYVDLFIVFAAIIFGTIAVGQASGFAPDYGQAKMSAARIFIVLDRKPDIDSYSEDGLKPVTSTGFIEFKQVYFKYPSRPTVRVLQGLHLKVEQGRTIALVGSSGCGKSTTVQLLERFYNPTKGQVYLDGYNIQSLNVGWLRAQMSLVSQEPILFACSIEENIAYGDNSRHVTRHEIISAAKQANIHAFIKALPHGYETHVGTRGAQLSGGQKQRVAIARALVRNPKILLLDEATSALDTESEKVVQEALERAQSGRTSLVIAHRLSTIQNADLIVVFHHGRVAEQGAHVELMELKGLYYKLNLAQQKKRPNILVPM